MSTRTLTRRAATALVAGIVSVVPVVGVASPAFAAGTGKVLASPCLNLRTGPSSAYGIIGCVPVNTSISIDCTVTGAAVSGPYGTTTLWDHTAYAGKSGYVSTRGYTPAPRTRSRRPARPAPAGPRGAWRTPWSGRSPTTSCVELFAENAYGTSGRYYAAINAFSSLQAAGMMHYTSTGIPRVRSSSARARRTRDTATSRSPAATAASSPGMGNPTVQVTYTPFPGRGGSSRLVPRPVQLARPLTHQRQGPAAASEKSRVHRAFPASAGPLCCRIRPRRGWYGVRRARSRDRHSRGNPDTAAPQGVAPGRLPPGGPGCGSASPACWTNSGATGPARLNSLRVHISRLRSALRSADGAPPGWRRRRAAMPSPSRRVNSTSPACTRPRPARERRARDPVGAHEILRVPSPSGAGSPSAASIPRACRRSAISATSCAGDRHRVRRPRQPPSSVPRPRVLSRLHAESPTNETVACALARGRARRGTASPRSRRSAISGAVWCVTGAWTSAPMSLGWNVPSIAGDRATQPAPHRPRPSPSPRRPLPFEASAERERLIRDVLAIVASRPGARGRCQWRPRHGPHSPGARHFRLSRRCAPVTGSPDRPYTAVRDLLSASASRPMRWIPFSRNRTPGLARESPVATRLRGGAGRHTAARDRRRRPRRCRLGGPPAQCSATHQSRWSRPRSHLQTSASSPATRRIARTTSSWSRSRPSRLQASASCSPPPAWTRRWSTDGRSASRRPAPVSRSSPRPPGAPGRAPA